MNLVYDKRFLSLVIFALLGVVLALGLNLFLKSSSLLKPFDMSISSSVSSNIAQKSGISTKQVLVEKSDKVAEVFLLSEFSLNGTVVGDVKAAIINHKGKGEYIFLNDSYEGYRLIEVYTNKAVFEKGGKNYTLYLYEQMQALQAQSLSAKKNGKTKVVIKAKKMFADIKRDGDNFFIPRALVREYMSLDTIFSQIRIISASVNGKFAGFMIRDVNSKGIFAKLGLRRGDSIVAINNKEFEGVSEPFKYFNDLENISKLSLSIKRSDKVKEFVYEIY